MAAMDVARSLSQHSLSSPPSASRESFRFPQEHRAAAPEPHYRLSRLNTPPSAAALRPPSIISRSVSAGMTFSFSKKEKEKQKEQKESHLRPPSPDERTQSRFGFTLRKKVSLASLMNSSGANSSSHADDVGSSRTSSSGGSGHLAVTVSPIVETPPPIPVPREEAEEDSDGDEDVHASGRFIKKNVWRTRHKMKLHPYPDVPYMQAYDPVVLENERYTYHLLRRLVPAGSPTFYQYPRVPATALDLGCGTGLWLIDAARIWRASQLVGLDIVDVALPPLIDGSLPNVRLVRGDFLNYALPFADGAFELVRMANLGLCVPNDSWVGLLREVWRVLTPGGRVELIDDQMGFTYGDVPIEETADVPAEAEGSSLPVPAADIIPLSPSTPRAPPPTPDVSGFFDSSDEEETDPSSDGEDAAPQTSDDEVVLASTPDSASERSSLSSDAGSTFNDTASTLVGDASERGSLEFKKRSSVPQLDFEPVHRPFSGVEHLVIQIPPPELLPAVDVTVEEGEMPLTPVPPQAPAAVVEGMIMTPTAPTPFPIPAPEPPASAAPPPSPTPTPSAPSPATSAFELESVGPWSTQCAASRDLERVYMRMLTDSFGLPARPGALAMPLLARVFCRGRGGHVEPPQSFHLKLAPVELAELVEERPHHGERDSGRGVRNWMTTVEWEGEKVKEKEGKESVRRSKGAKKETLSETPIPQGLSAKAAERLGIVGAGVPAPQVRRQRTLLDSPDESEEEDEDEETDVDEPAPVPGSQIERPPLSRGASMWVPPSEWDAPPPSVLRTDSPEAAVAPSPSSKTITAAASARTITAAASTKTVTAASSTKAVPPLATVAPSRAESPQPPTPTHRTHTRGGSTASAVSTASSGAWSETGPHGVSHGRVQHPGLILWPATFIPMAPSELEMHTTKHMQTLLSCKPALAEYIGDYVDPATGARIVSEEAFEDAVWEYECFRRPRFNWPELPEARLESGEVSPDVPTPGSARSTHHVVPRTPTFVPDAKVTVGPYQSGELTHVRTFSVFGAVKDGPDATPFL